MATVSVLVVGGGGGGGGYGGGGAGGYKIDTSHTVSAGHYTVTVGLGGNGSASSATKGTTGGDSTFDTITAHGGGGGGAFDDTNHDGLNGASGGGGGTAVSGAAAGGSGGTGTGGEGNNGGRGADGGTCAGGGGGSAAVGAAGNGGAGIGGDGGAGTSNSLSGSALFYAGGGGGGGVTHGGAGGSSIGGTGGTNVAVGAAASPANRGAGGGGAGKSTGGKGSDGVVIISYTSTDISGATGGTITINGSFTVHTFTSNGTFGIPAQLASDSTFTFSTTTGLTALNRLQTDSTISFATTTSLSALSHFTADSTISLSTITDLTARTASTITTFINGVDQSSHLLRYRSSIEMNANGTPDTASLVVRGGAKGVTPSAGQRVTVYQGLNTLLFDGEITTLTLLQRRVSTRPSWRMDCIDFTFQLRRRLVTKTWVSTSASTIVLDIVSTFTSGFTTTQVQSGLPSVTFVCDFEDAAAALTRLADLVGANWKLFAKDLYFRSTSTLTNPADLTTGNLKFKELQFSTKYDQPVNRAIVKGGGTLGGTATVVSPGAIAGSSTIPLNQALGFSPSGAALLSLPVVGTYPIVTQTIPITYSGTVLSSAVQAPSHAPFFSSVSVPGNAPQGFFYYAFSYVTSAGETGIGPIFSLFVNFYPGGAPTGTINLELSSGIADQPPDATITSINVYRSVSNGNANLLFFAGTYTGPVWPNSWPTPRLFADNKADNQLGTLAPASGATCPQGAKPPYGSPPGAPDFYFPALTGCVNTLGGVIPTVPPGATVSVAAVVNDTSKQTALAALEGGDGIYEGVFTATDAAITPALATTIGTAKLAALPSPQLDATYLSEDSATVPLTSITVNIATIAATLQVQTVSLTWIPERKAPQRRVRASNQRRTLNSWLNDVNARVLHTTVSV